jgi:hypothetical protein
MPNEQRDWDRQADANRKILEAEIEDLTSGHWDNFRRDYPSFWGHVKRINALFKSTKPLRREDREQLWTRLGTVCEEAKAAGQKERGEKLGQSQRHMNDILHAVSESCPSWIGGLGPATRDDLIAMGQRLKEAGEMLSARKHEMLGEHKQECFGKICEARKTHDAHWAGLKAEGERKHSNFQERVRANLEKNRERHRKAAEALERHRAHAEELRDNIASAWSDEYSDRAQGWLAEEEDKIRDIEESLARIEEWIREDEEKLEG